MQKEQESVDSFVCPSFSAYSSNKLDDIADQVTRESHLRAQNDNDENDFEFVAFQKAADGVFVDGNAASHVFPIFNRDLLTERDGDGGGRISGAAAIRVPFRKLLIGDEEHGSVPSPASSSSSLSEVEDDLEAIPAGTYCLWTPKSVQASPSRCKKSNSTGSSSSSSSSLKRWKLLSFLRRSNSDGKGSLVLLSSSSSSSLGSNSAKKKGAKEGNSKEQCGTGSAGGNSPRIAGKKVPAAGEKKVLSPAYEELYGRKREIRRSYLPYRQNLVNWVLR